MSWSGYAPEGGEPACSFCGEAGGPQRLVTVAQGGAAICVVCAVRVSDIMRRAGEPPPPPEPIDPRDPGPPIAVRLESRPLGDLGHPRVDARLLLAIGLRDGRAAGWMRAHGVDEAAIRDEFRDLDLGFD